MPSGFKRPINLRLGSQRVTLGYTIDMPDGTTILAADVPRLGFHASFHPSGIINVKDNQGFNRRIDFRPQALGRNSVKELIAWADELLESMDSDPEFDEDLLALPNPNAIQPSLLRRSRWGMDIDVFGALRPQRVEFPFFLVEQDAVPKYLATLGEHASILLAPRSKRIALALEPSRIFSFTLDVQKPLDFIRGIPIGEEIVETITASIGYLTTLRDEDESSPASCLEQKFQSLDKNLLVEEALNLVGFRNPPVFLRYTRDGFEPVTMQG